MKKGTTVVTVIIGVGVALAVLVYGGAAGAGMRGPTATSAADATVVPIGVTANKSLTRAQKLAKALKACKKETPKSKRKSCEKKARKHNKSKPKPKHETTETGKTPSETPQQELARAKTVSTSPPAASVTAGKSLFASNCEGCHGPTGEGTNTGPNLHSMPRAQSIAGVIEQLIAPEGAMPPFDSALTFAEKEEAADYVAVDITHVATESH
jgi:hypothetical protein